MRKYITNTITTKQMERILWSAQFHGQYAARDEINGYPGAPAHISKFAKDIDNFLKAAAELHIIDYSDFDTIRGAAMEKLSNSYYQYKKDYAPVTEAAPEAAAV